MPFDLTFTDAVSCDSLSPGREADGVILIGDFRETFSAALDLMSKRDYLQQWRYAARRIAEGSDCSAIITSFADRGGEIVGMWWPLYLCAGGLVAVQNRLILREVVDGRFSVNTCYDYVGPHNTMTEDGDAISEWVISVSELAAFAVRVKGRLSEYI
jgi:hypothetical protein